ncbi:polyhydroxyalkanoate synthesis regulator phasin [Methanohalophilus levihalophilus]|uniref:phasin family protein n=1 Tax=Methanohalophilus levihalophilus TaxID=1431282 RepID=UPI001AE2306F|nr:phasin family protein [Methanohalophilus levihalophilus]MBP2029842.1 polyhydroxyalkanoate synthesis regulator phasin [Methanohalophilus levihalophilus]
MGDPVDYMKKLGLFGIGIYAMTEEKIDEYVKELIESGEINREEGKKYVQELIDRKNEQQEDLEEKISSKVKETFGKTEIASKEEIKALEDKIAKLEEMLAEALKKDE